MKSGIDMLEEILKRLDTLEKRIGVVDNNIKALVNGSNLAKLINNAAETPLDNWSKATQPSTSDTVSSDDKPAGFKNFGFQTVDASKMKNKKTVDKRSRAKLPSIMVKGKLKIDKDGSNIPLSGVDVTVFDDKDKLIKKTKTNRAGHWMSQLAPGKYVVLFDGEINGQKLLPQNRNFEVPDKLPDGQKEMEIL